MVNRVMRSSLDMTVRQAVPTIGTSWCACVGRSDPRVRPKSTRVSSTSSSRVAGRSSTRTRFSWPGSGTARWRYSPRSLCARARTGVTRRGRLDTWKAGTSIPDGGRGKSGRSCCVRARTGPRAPRLHRDGLGYLDRQRRRAVRARGLRIRDRQPIRELHEEAVIRNALGRAGPQPSASIRAAPRAHAAEGRGVQGAEGRSTSHAFAGERREAECYRTKTVQLHPIATASREPQHLSRQ